MGNCPVSCGILRGRDLAQLNGRDENYTGPANFVSNCLAVKGFSKSVYLATSGYYGSGIFGDRV